MADLIERLRTELVSANKHGDPDLADLLRDTLAALEAALEDGARLDYIERTFSGMTNRERYLPVKMIWGKGSNGRTLREACDKYMKRDAAIDQARGIVPEAGQGVGGG